MTPGWHSRIQRKTALIVVPAGSCTSSIRCSGDNGQYILTSHQVTVGPIRTVLHILEHRAHQTESTKMRSRGWRRGRLIRCRTHCWPAFIERSPGRKERTCCPPESRHEVEAIAADPKPSTVSWCQRHGDQLQAMPFSHYSVIHLALHGYVDPEIPDRSALVSLHSRSHRRRLLPIREIRNLHLNASWSRSLLQHRRRASREKKA